jgi:hypothetical protein
MSEEINVAEKREEIIGMWNALLKIVDRTIKGLEDSRKSPSASMIKELTAFMKASGEILAELDKFKREDKLKANYEKALSIDDGMPAPFPVEDSVTEPLDV